MQLEQDIIDNNLQMNVTSGMALYFCQFFSLNILKIPHKTSLGKENFTACTNCVSHAYVFTEKLI